MKRIVLSTALFLATAGSLAFAQQPQATPQDQQPPAPITRPQHLGHHHNPHQEAMMLSHRLHLSPDQTAKIEPILAEREQKMAALHANTSLTPQDMHQQMHALHQQERTQMDAVLTPDQQEHLKSMHHGQHGQPHGDAQPAPSL